MFSSSAFSFGRLFPRRLLICARWQWRRRFVLAFALPAHLAFDAGERTYYARAYEENATHEKEEQSQHEIEETCDAPQNEYPKANQNQKNRQHFSPFFFAKLATPCVVRDLRKKRDQVRGNKPNN